MQKQPEITYFLFQSVLKCKPTIAVYDSAQSLHDKMIYTFTWTQVTSNS